MARLRGQKWQADVKVGDKRVRRTFDTKSEALAFEKHGINVVHGCSTRTCSEVFGEVFFLTWRGTKDERHCEGIVREFIEFFGPTTTFGTLTKKDFTRFIISQKAKGLTESTIDRKLTRLNMVLKHAHEQGDIRAPLRVPLFNADNPRERFLSDQEVEELFGLLSPVRYRDLSIFLLETGCRVSEALRLEWRDIHGESSVSLYQTKSGRPRTIPLTDTANAVLSQRRGFKRPFADCTYPAYAHAWQLARAKSSMAGDPDVVIHILRHTLASRLAQSGQVDLYRIKQWLGHSQIRTTERYAHLTPTSLDIGLEVLNSR